MRIEVTWTWVHDNANYDGSLLSGTEQPRRRLKEGVNVETHYIDYCYTTTTQTQCSLKLRVFLHYIASRGSPWVPSNNNNSKRGWSINTNAAGMNSKWRSCGQQRHPSRRQIEKDGTRTDGPAFNVLDRRKRRNWEKIDLYALWPGHGLIYDNCSSTALAHTVHLYCRLKTLRDQYNWLRTWYFIETAISSPRVYYFL